MGAQYRAVIIGAGLAGCHMPQSHLEGYLLHPRTRLVGVIDDNFRVLALLKGKIPGRTPVATDVSNVGVMRPDIVSIATPEETHVEVFRRVMERVTPRGVFLEKPIATSLEGAQEITDFCARKGIALQVNHARAWDQDVRRRRAPKTIRHGGPPWRNDVHAHHLASLYRPRPEVVEEGDRGLRVDGEELWGELRPGTMVKAISDLLHAIEYGTEPRCSGYDATIAVRETLRAR